MFTLDSQTEKIACDKWKKIEVAFAKDMNVFKVSKQMIIIHVMNNYALKYVSGEQEMLGASTLLPGSKLQKI